MGEYRRRLRLRGGPGLATAELEDDFHHFAVALHHDGETVTGVAGHAVRFPWSTCPLAIDELQRLVGAPLDRAATAVGRHLVVRHNCTHLFDLAGLALAQAGTGRADRDYDVCVPDRAGPNGDRTSPVLRRDGQVILTWELEGLRIVSPPPYAGQKLRGGFLAWAEATLDPDEAEAAIVLRRACEISYGRQGDLDQFETALPMAGYMSGTCFTFQPGRMASARRMRGTTRDFTGRPDDLLAGA